MTKAEEDNPGVLTVDVDYVKMGQAINNAIYMLKKFKDKLDMAAVEKGLQVDIGKSKE
jgi:hypothetical protein